MRLVDCEFRPGKVLEVLDEYGTIKASCAGYFSEEDDVELLPPITPFFQSSASNFNQPKPEDLIWVVINRLDQQELFYFFQGNVKGVASHILQNKPEDAQILASKDAATGKAELYYTTDDGWKMSSNDSKIQIDKDDNINIGKDDSDNRGITIDEKSVNLGGKEGSEPAILGNQLVDCLSNLNTVLGNLAFSLKGSPYTAAAGTDLEAQLPKFGNLIGKLKSKNVTLN